MNATRQYLIRPLYLATLNTHDLYWMLICYNIAWDNPMGLEYQVRGTSWANGEHFVPGPPKCPFNNRAEFEGWCNAGEGSDLPNGKYLLGLTRDIRRCSAEAIRLILEMSNPLAPRESQSDILPIPVIRDGSSQDCDPNPVVREHRTRPLGVTEAGRLMGFVGDNASVRKRMRAFMDSTKYKFYRISRQSYVFYIRKFPIDKRLDVSPSHDSIS
jgi:hypothetical protein